MHNISSKFEISLEARYKQRKQYVNKDKISLVYVQWPSLNWIISPCVNTSRLHEVCFRHHTQWGHPEQPSPHTLCQRPRTTHHPVPTEPKWLPSGHRCPVFPRWATLSPHATPREVYLHMAVGLDAAGMATGFESVTMDVHVQKCVRLV